MIAVTFALPEESREFRAALKLTGRNGVPPHEWLLGKLGGEEIAVLHTGIGQESAARRIAVLLAAVQPRFLVAAGFAGGLDPRLRVGDLVVDSAQSAPELVQHTRETADTSRPVTFGPIISSQLPVETAAAKAALARDSAAIAVDMETATLAKACAATDVPFLAIRAISDTADDPLPVPFTVWFNAASQRPRPIALLAHLASHPTAIAPFIRFVRGLRPARIALAHFLERLIQSAKAETNR